mmetsp:Transcript_121252/g.220540  ORF Transcript_121252/g.220540 Transcript_121252/m.220540 type:complete len:650 (-) Transcript_121252:16-1965(-)
MGGSVYEDHGPARRWHRTQRSQTDGPDEKRHRHPEEKKTGRSASGKDGDAVMSFNGQYKFLSNFSWSELEFEGLRYPSVEHAFQAAKVRTNSARRAHGFLDEGVTFGEAKRLGRRVPLRDDWKEIREDVMERCLLSKFSDPALRAKLVATGNRELIDGHSGSPDLIWGYHFPSQAGENRLGILLMGVRSKLSAKQHVSDQVSSRGSDVQAEAPDKSHVLGATAALYHLDWPMKCLNDGLPEAYANRIWEISCACELTCGIVQLPRRRICIALRGRHAAIDKWEHRIRTEAVDVNSRGRPCRERMLVELHRCAPLRPEIAKAKLELDWWSEVDSWPALSDKLANILGLPSEKVHSLLGPEVPELPSKVNYAPNRTAVMLDGKRFPLCLNENDATVISEALLGQPHAQTPRGPGEPVPVVSDIKGSPSIFGGKFARTIDKLLDPSECKQLIDLAESNGFGLAGSRGFNPYARFAMRCFIDAPQVGSVLTRRLASLLPTEYPPGSGRPLVGVNERCRFLKYVPGMHHSGDHTDCAHEDSRGRSFLTVQVYLNDSFEGGRTTFISDRLVPIKPAAGRAVVFDHELYHRGGIVSDGVKYAIRLDVLYGHPDADALAGQGAARTQPHAGKGKGKSSGKGKGKGHSRWSSRNNAAE